MHPKRPYGWLLLALVLLLPALGWGQQGGPSPTGVISITQEQLDALSAGGACTARASYRVSDADEATAVDLWCPPEGIGPLHRRNTEARGGGATATTGFVWSDTAARAILPELTSFTQSATIGLHLYACVYPGTEGITVTLSPLATSPGGHYVLLVCDDAGGTFTLAPDGTDLINFENAPQTMSGRGSRMVIDRFGTVSWSVITTVTLEAFLNALADNLMTLDTSQTVTGAKSFDDVTITGDLTASGPINLANADDLVLPKQAGPTQTVDGDCRWNTTTHKMTCGHNAVATITTPQVLCRAVGTSVNDSGSGSGADFNHTVTCSIPANSLFAGDVLEVRIFGKLSTGSSGTNIIAGLKQSTTTDIIRTISSTTANNVAGNWWVLRYTLYISADPGASVSVTGYAGATEVDMRDTFNSSQTGPVNLATNGALTLTPFTRWTAAGNNDNEVDVQGIIVVRY